MSPTSSEPPRAHMGECNGCSCFMCVRNRPRHGPDTLYRERIIPDLPGVH